MDPIYFGLMIVKMDEVDGLGVVLFIQQLNY